MKSTFTSDRSVRAIKHILTSLRIRKMTAKELAVEICMSVSSAQQYLAHLQQNPRRVRICSFESGPGLTPPIYGIGTTPNAKRKPKRTPADRFAALKAEPFEYRKSLTLRRLSRLRARSAKTPNTWASALFTGIRLPLNAEG